MRYSTAITAVLTVLSLSACGHHRQDNMTAPLNKIRAMVAQSSLMAAQAACMDPPARSELINGAVVLLRRATAGPEMASIHKTMGGDMNMDSTGNMNMPMNKGDKAASPQQTMHLAVHTAGGDAFGLLDALTGQPGLSCADVHPIALAASAALLREQHEDEKGRDEATQKLDQAVNEAVKKLDDELQQSLGANTPHPIKTLALDLLKI